MDDFDSKGPSFAPMTFVAALRKAYPIFNETDQQGRHKQQDSDECY